MLLSKRINVHASGENASEICENISKIKPLDEIHLVDYTIVRYSVIVIVNFGNKAAVEIWENDECRKLPRELWTRAKALLTIMHSSSTIGDLRIRGEPPNVRLHILKGDRKGYWSVTIKLPWCITFKFKNGEFSEVSIEDYHGG